MTDISKLGVMFSIIYFASNLIFIFMYFYSNDAGVLLGIHLINTPVIGIINKYFGSYIMSLIVSAIINLCVVYGAGFFVEKKIYSLIKNFLNNLGRS